MSDAAADTDTDAQTALSHEFIDRIATDEDFRAQLKADPMAAIEAAGFAERAEALLTAAEPEAQPFVQINHNHRPIALMGTLVGAPTLAPVTPQPQVTTDGRYGNAW